MNKKTFNNFVETLLAIEDRDVMLNFLFGLLTKKELEDLPKRLEVVEMLKKGIPQREISQKLGVGIATITRGSKELKKGNFKYV